MSSTSPECTALVSQAATALQHDELPAARALLAEALRFDPRCVRAWILMAAAVESPEQRRECLVRALELEPTLEWVRQVLVELPPPKPPKIRAPLVPRIPPRPTGLARVERPPEPAPAVPLGLQAEHVEAPLEIPTLEPTVTPPPPTATRTGGRPRAPAAVGWILGLGLGAGLLWLGLSYYLFLILYWLDETGRVDPWSSPAS